MDCIASALSRTVVPDFRVLVVSLHGMNYAQRRITVMGLGRFGGGSGVTRWLAHQGAKVQLTDLLPADQLTEPLAELRDLIEAGKVTLRLGEHDERDFVNADLVVASPAVPKPWENRYLAAAIRRGVPITTETRLLLERINRRRVIGITGTAGKSTTAAMIHHALSKAGARAHLGGNIGGSLLNTLHAIRGDDWVVLELSSFMLHWLGERVGSDDAAGISPHIAVMTNLQPNHLDWHGTFEHYEASKQNVFRYQSADDHAIDGRDLPAPTHEIPLIVPGRHNQRNSQIALAVAGTALDTNADHLGPHLGDFHGLPHRLQFVIERDRVRCYNDSKSTTPGATILAIESFDDPAQVHLIAGGHDKGSDLTPIADAASRLAGFYAIGATGRALAQSAKCEHAMYCETLDCAVETALSRARSGDVLLLSPGCASWDQFTNFEERGKRFIQLVQHGPLHSGPSPSQRKAASGSRQSA